jgi:hypothetical protein
MNQEESSFKRGFQEVAPRIGLLSNFSRPCDTFRSSHLIAKATPSQPGLYHNLESSSDLL